MYLFAPKSREDAAKIVLPYLTKAYDALYAQQQVTVDPQALVIIVHIAG